MNRVKKLAALMVCMAMILAALPGFAAVGFSDIGSVTWANEAINSLAEAGIVNGIGNGLFAPMDNVTRAQFVHMIVNAFGFTGNGIITFSDVNDQWFANSVLIAANNGIVNGYDGRFNPDDNITCQDAAVILKRVLDMKGVNLPAFVTAPETLGADYALDAIGALRANGVIKTEMSFAPFLYASRAQAAYMIYGAYKLYMGGSPTAAGTNSFAWADLVGVFFNGSGNITIGMEGDMLYIIDASNIDGDLILNEDLSVVGEDRLSFTSLYGRSFEIIVRDKDTIEVVNDTWQNFNGVYSKDYNTVITDDFTWADLVGEFISTDDSGYLTIGMEGDRLYIQEAATYRWDYIEYEDLAVIGARKLYYESDGRSFIIHVYDKDTFEIVDDTWGNFYGIFYRGQEEVFYISPPDDTIFIDINAGADQRYIYCAYSGDTQIAVTLYLFNNMDELTDERTVVLNADSVANRKTKWVDADGRFTFYVKDGAEIVFVEDAEGVYTSEYRMWAI